MFGIQKRMCILPITLGVAQNAYKLFQKVKIHNAYLLESILRVIVL